MNLFRKIAICLINTVLLGWLMAEYYLGGPDDFAGIFFFFIIIFIFLLNFYYYILYDLFPDNPHRNIWLELVFSGLLLLPFVGLWLFTS